LGSRNSVGSFIEMGTPRQTPRTVRMLEYRSEFAEILGIHPARATRGSSAHVA
jgi:hypothetical protein